MSPVFVQSIHLSGAIVSDSYRERVVPTREKLRCTSPPTLGTTNYNASCAKHFLLKTPVERANIVISRATFSYRSPYRFFLFFLSVCDFSATEQSPLPTCSAIESPLDHLRDTHTDLCTARILHARSVKPRPSKFIHRRRTLLSVDLSYWRR